MTILQTIVKGSPVVDCRDPRHVGAVMEIGPNTIKVRWSESDWISWMPTRFMVLAPAELVEATPMRRALMLAEVIPAT